MSDTIEAEFQRIIGAYRLLVTAGAPLPEAQLATMRGLFFGGVKFALTRIAEKYPRGGGTPTERLISAMDNFVDELNMLSDEVDRFDKDNLKQVVEILKRRDLKGH